MKSRFAISIAALTLTVLFAVPLIAHHSLAAEYDATKAKTITGVFTKVEWVNPHVWLYINTTDSAGKIVPWKIEVGSPSALSKVGFTKDLLDLKSTYSLDIWPSRDESGHGAGRVLTTPDGQTFDVHDMWGMDLPVR